MIYENAETFIIQQNGRAHTCNEHPIESKAPQELSQQVISRIQNLFRSGTRMPKSVQKVLREDQARNDLEFDVEPTINQIKYQVQKYKKEQFGGSEITLGELKSFLTTNSTVPTDIDEPFVLDFSIKFGSNNTLDISTEDEDEDEEEEKSSFWFLLTTVRLLSIVKKSTLIAADSTYKLVWLGFPGVLLGTVDMKKQYHKICFGLTSSEKTSDWEEMFQVKYLLLYKSS